MSIHDVPSFRALSHPMTLSSSKDGIEGRDFDHFTSWKTVHGAYMTRAGSELRKSIGGEQGFQVIFMQHTGRNLMLEDPRKAGRRSILLNQLGKERFSR
jgi:hypothetical protein